MRNRDARFDEQLRQAIERRANGGFCRQQRVIVNDEDAIVRKLFVSRGRQSEPIRDTGASLVRTGGHCERKIEIVGASRHRADDGKVTFSLHGGGHPVTTRGHEI